jgi:O-antigen ligase/polysaccharide polymerase Wzy-like membrane protein
MRASAATAGLAIVLSALAGGLVGLAVAAGPLALLFAAALLAAAAAIEISLDEGTGIRQPVVGLLVALSILTVSWQGVQGPVSVPISDFPFLFALPLIGLGLLRREMPLVLPNWLLAVAGGMILGALLAALFVPNPPAFVIGPGGVAGATASRQSDVGFLLRIIYALVLVPVVIAAAAGSWGRVRFFADVWVASTAICALAGCLDSLTHAGIANAVVANGPFPFDRAIGLTDQPNYLGQFISMALPVAIVRAYQTTGLPRLALVSSIGVLVLGLQVSGSRLGLVGAVIGVAVLGTLVPRVRYGVAVGGITLAVLGAASLAIQPGGESALERFSGGDPQAEAGRRFLLERSWEIARDHLATGVGFSRILDSHSLPIQFLLAGGIVALLAFMLWVWGMGRVGVSVVRDERAPPASRELAAALTAALAAWLIPGLINPQLIERFMYIPAGLLLALGYLVARSYRSRTDAATVQRTRPAVTGRQGAREGELAGAAGFLASPSS